ncbi:MAG: universal stress protein [Deltaproteobacteria bacterium]
MGRTVLVAVDSVSASEASIFYGIELAARMKSLLLLIAVSSPGSPRKSQGSDVARRYVDGGTESWMDRALAESQQRGVTLEIFVASGEFFEEVTRFVESQPAVQFIVMAAPKERASKGRSKFASALERLHQEFEGEILLVEKAGRITRVSDLYLKSSAQERYI